MNIIIIGAGRMGSWIAALLSQNHHVAIIESNPGRNQNPKTQRLNNFKDIPAFNADMIINAVSLDATLPVFHEILPLVHADTILADMASVKNGISRFYRNCGCRFVSTHPMFGPTFANMETLHDEHAIIIEESDQAGKKFFEDFFLALGLNIHFMNFKQHDESMSGSLSVPFMLSMLFAGNVDRRVHPGTTWEKHMQIAQGLFSEDDSLLSEVLMNPYTLDKIHWLKKALSRLQTAIEKEDKQAMLQFIHDHRSNLSQG